MEELNPPQDGALPFSDVSALLAAAAGAEKQQALVARIFLPRPVDPATSASVDQFAHLTSLARQLQQLCQERYRNSEYLGGQSYIWHREAPSISVICPTSASGHSTSNSSSQTPPHILFHLRTGGECVEDEWFATHLLIRASSHFARQQICITVEDEDGQFLLIEAAEHLPDWITPEGVVNRVWIFGGHLHLIPPHYTSNNDGTIFTSRALELITDKSILTRASDDLETAAFARAFDFPSAATPHHHRTLVYLPLRIARILSSDQQLISSCVTSIQSRDTVSSRSGSRLVHFPPPSQSSSTPATDGNSNAKIDDKIVLTPVRMTRHLYAQLLYDRFFPPRQLGPQWQAAVEKYRVRLNRQTNASKVEDEAEVQAELNQGRWHDLGAKIWCGLEMAYTESLARRTRTKARPMSAASSTIPEQEREKLISSLTKLGYFHGEIEGSAKWKQLEEEALSQFAKSSSSAVKDDRDSPNEILLSDVVDQILRRQDSIPSSLTILASDAAGDKLKAAEDDDSWLHLNSEDIESILQSKAGTASNSTNPVSEQDTFRRLGAFNSRMEDFINTKSDVQGALFQDELNADDMLLDDDDLLFEDMDEEELEQRIRSQVEERMRTAGEEEKRKLVERLIPRMSEQEWTRKPALHSQDWTSNSATGNKAEDFLSSIDRIASERNKDSTQTSEGSSKELTRRDNNLSAAHADFQRRLASQYMRETSYLLSSQGHHRYDGASDSDDEELEQETSPEVRRQRAKEFDLEPDVEASDDVQDGALWEDVPPEVMDGDEDTELGNLLEYARISLGLTKEQYEEILDDRKSKGKFVPSQKKSTQPSRAAAEVETAKLDTFESVMSAMESQLNHLKSNPPPPPTSSSSSSSSFHPAQPRPPSSSHPSSTTKPSQTKTKETSVDAEDQELLSHLLKSNSDLPSSLLPHIGKDGSHITAEQMEAFLRSFQAQIGTTGPGAGSGPVEQLMRRFGLGALPADQDPYSQQ